MRRLAAAASAVLAAVVLCGSCGGGSTAAAGGEPSTAAPPAPASRTVTAPRGRGRPAVPKPRLRHRFIPLLPRRLRETSFYAQRHYGLRTATINAPHVIVEHLTVNDSIDATFNTFALNVPDVELHELPGLCSQFAIARNGAIYQFTPVTFLCRHTVGLNWTAIGIEHVGYREADVFARRVQLAASLRLTRWLRCRYGIAVRDVIGHAESLSSPFHRERVAALRTQTHGDWQRWAMRRYRAQLRAQGGC
jgi:N-acetylmuramoyl-L-alanine amidase